MIFKVEDMNVSTDVEFAAMIKIEAEVGEAAGGQNATLWGDT